MNLSYIYSKNINLVVFLVGLMLAQTGLHAQTSTFPSHCLPSETVFLSAKMKKVINTPKQMIYKDTGKILSLCADKAKDPISKLTYRYGLIGSIELERIATRSNRFGYAEFALGDRVSIDAYFFDIGEFAYYVTVAGAMGSGISLAVYRGDKQIVDLFSGNDDTTDFYFPMLIKADPVIQEREPEHLAGYKN